MGYIHSAKGQEISKAIFHETPLPQKQKKYYSWVPNKRVGWKKCEYGGGKI